MTMYYRVIKENFLWEVGAILKRESGDDGYRPIEDIWNKSKNNNGVQNEYISYYIIESQGDYFERVYRSDIDKMVFLTAQALKEKYDKAFK